MRRASLCLVPLVAVLAGCGGTGASSADESSRCETVPPAAIEFLQSAFDTGYIVQSATVRSDDFSHVYLIATVDDHGSVALFAMNRLDGSGLIMSVNDEAFRLTEMARSQDLADPFGEEADGASEALSCV